ncbi:MAG TPA: AGE family epimerase/isomerase [Parafilimonas sp.]|nr:AGE family epimerase/isomerase [Parafilimonas sp.]
MNRLHQYKKELTEELNSILDYWMENTIDELNGGFFGKIDNANDIYTTAPKGAVLNARILWTFSAAYNFSKDEKYLSTATRAFEYIRDHIIDKTYGGVFWTVDSNGNPLDTKKQIYALAFCIYGLAEYYAASGDKEALSVALSLYDDIETHSNDKINKGYYEAFARNWKETEDLRLSAKDANEKKTMNTHLHIIEAYANLYKVHPSSRLKNKIIELLELFNVHFIDKKTFHLKLFFDEAWNEKPDVISYGHDIEAAWLLQQCAEIIHHEQWINTYKKHAVKVADAAAEGLDKDGGIWYECPQPLKGSNVAQQNIVKEKHWWPQAEAMVGFFNAWQLTNNEKYVEHSIKSWQFVKDYLIDKKNGEWFWGINEDHSVMQHEDKAGLWKCPYHNSRACLEIINRIQD